MMDKCYCDEFGVGTDWEVPAPEDTQRCSLVEWLSRESKDMMKENEIASRKQWETAEEETGLYRSDPGCEAGLSHEWKWEHYLEVEYVILEEENEDSEAWSVVSGVEESRLADSDTALRSPVEAEPGK
jgi:hypothetical protein